MLIEKNIFISGLIISIGYADNIGNIQGFIMSGMNDISFDPCQQYANWKLGLAFWSKCTKLSFIEWPFMYNPVGLFIIPNKTWDVVRYSNLVRVKTRRFYSGNNLIMSILSEPIFIRSQVRFLDPFYFCITYSMYSVTKRNRYDIPFSVNGFEVSSFHESKDSYGYWMFLEIEFSYGWILVFDHLGRELGSLYIKELCDNFVRKHRDYHQENDICMGEFIIKVKRTKFYITLQLLCGHLLESYVRIKVDALIRLEPQVIS